MAWFPSFTRFLLLGIFALASAHGQDTGFFRIAADPEKGFHWPYYLVVSSSVTSPTVLLVEPNNPRIVTIDDYDIAIQEEAATNRAWKYGFEIFGQLGTPLLVPFFPRRYPDRLGDAIFWTTHLDAGTFRIGDEAYRRLDLQLIAMIEDAKARLSTMGIEVDARVFMDGFSSSGEFVNRFTLLHPQAVRAAAIGATALMMPVATWKGEQLPYPVGVADMQELSGEGFDLDRFKQVPLYVYLGDEDTNDVVFFVYEPIHREQIMRLFGNTPVSRFAAVKEVYDSVDTDSQFVLYPGVGHELTEETIADVNAFFERHWPVSFIEYLYLQFLGRTGDPEGIDAWTAQLESGNRTAVQVVVEFFRAPEFQQVVAPIARLYFATFNRIPDAAGLSAWVGRFRGGSTLERIAAEFIASTEFQQRYGSSFTDQAFLELLYRNVLDRAPDQAGLQSWLAALSAGMSRSQVLAFFSESEENQTTTKASIRVTLAYQGLLRRTPTEEEMTTDAGISLSDLIFLLLTSADYMGPKVP